jgi:hypothetical protein
MFPRNLGTTTCMARVSGQKRVTRDSYSGDPDETLDALPSYKGYTVAAHNRRTRRRFFKYNIAFSHTIPLP